MKKFIVEIEVDEKVLESYFPGEGRSMEDMIDAELGWVAQSGIYISTVKEIT